MRRTDSLEKTLMLRKIEGRGSGTQTKESGWPLETRKGKEILEPQKGIADILISAQ